MFSNTPALGIIVFKKLLAILGIAAGTICLTAFIKPPNPSLSGELKAFANVVAMSPNAPVAVSAEYVAP